MAVRELQVAVTVSIAAHVAVLAWIVDDRPDPRQQRAHARLPELAEQAARQPQPRSESPVPDDAPLEVVLLDEPSIRPASAVAAPPGATAAPAASPAAPPARAEATLAIRSTDRSRTVAPAAEPGQPASEPPAAQPAHPTSMLAMRRPEAPDPMGLSAKFLEDFLARSEPLAPLPDVPYARIDAEITELRRRSHDPDHPADLQRLVQLLDERAQVELKPQHGGTYHADEPGFTAKVDQDGNVRIADKANLQLHGLGATFDVTDWAMRAVGNDPYASEKLKFLDRTRDQRAAIRSEHRHDQLAHATQLMQRNIDALWAQARDLATRKQGLFELWDECAEDGDAALIAGSADARKAVTDFIKVKLTGASAYTADELAKLNRARRSRAAFAPYQ